MKNLRNALHHLILQTRLYEPTKNKNMSSYRTNLRELRLQVLLFCHFMYEDDDNLSLLEKRTLIKFIKSECDSLPDSTEKEFIEWMDNPPSLGFILDFAKENKYSYEDLDEAIRAFVHHTDSKSKYHPVIRDVRKKLILEKDFLKK